jgi:hypothetical protein
MGTNGINTKKEKIFDDASNVLKTFEYQSEPFDIANKVTKQENLNVVL